MRFFGRKDEIAELHNIRNLSLHTARFTIVTGRRRSGKTSLLLKAYEDVEDLLYFFVARKSEEELCKDFVNEIKEKLQVPILGDVSRFADIFKYLLQLSKTRPLTIIIDEFQDFKRVNSSVFSDMQKIWDLNKQDAHVNLVVCGSIYSLMNIIFKNNKQPLYGRQTGEIKVTPFPPSEALQILKEKRKGTYNVIKIDPAYRPNPVEHKQVFGVTFEQGRNEVKLDDPALFENIPTQNKVFTDEAKRDLIISLITLKYTQSNSVCYVKDGQAIGIGAGQQSRIHCTRLAGNKADIWWLRQHPKVMNLPFVDGIRRADRDNTIDVYISEDHEDVLRDGTWQMFFKEKPEVPCPSTSIIL